MHQKDCKISRENLMHRLFFSRLKFLTFWIEPGGEATGARRRHGGGWLFHCTILPAPSFMSKNAFLLCLHYSDFVVAYQSLHSKYYKHWLSTLAHPINCVGNRILNHGLNHRLLFSLFKFFALPWIFWQAKQC